MTRITIADYDPRWPAMFEEEKARILGVIGMWLVAIGYTDRKTEFVRGIERKADLTNVEDA